MEIPCNDINLQIDYDYIKKLNNILKDKNLFNDELSIYNYLYKNNNLFVPFGIHASWVYNNIDVSTKLLHLSLPRKQVYSVSIV
jgi:hypothetical protein